MPVTPIHPDDPASESQRSPCGPFGKLRQHARRWLDKGQPNYLLNLFTALLVGSALLIMLVVGSAIYLIYSDEMVENAGASATSMANFIMRTEVDTLLQEGPDGLLMPTLNKADVATLDVKMQRFLVPFNMHKITLFSPGKKIIYSTDAQLIGKIGQDNEDLDRVIASGKPMADMYSSEEQIKDAAELGSALMTDAAIVEAYSPLFDSRHQLLGVFVVYVDITKTREAISNVLLLSLSALGAVLFLCLFSLYRPMKRGTLSLITAHRELNDLATKDYLTGAFNRRYINERVKQEFHRMRRQIDTELIKKSIGFIMADIDFL